MGLDYNHFDCDGCAQEVNHLLVSESGDGHLANLHQPAALSQPCLPGEAKWLYISNNTLKIDVETKLTQAVPPQCHFCCFTASCDNLESEFI